MFKLNEFLDINRVNLELTSNDKEGLLKELANMLKDEVDDFESFYNDLLRREEVGSTAMEYGLAIPHVRSSHIKTFRIVVGVKKEGVDFVSLDGKKSKLFFLIATNDKYNDYHLDALVKIVKIISNENIVGVLTNSKSKEGLIQLIKRLEEI